MASFRRYSCFVYIGIALIVLTVISKWSASVASQCRGTGYDPSCGPCASRWYGQWYREDSHASHNWFSDKIYNINCIRSSMSSNTTFLTNNEGYTNRNINATSSNTTLKPSAQACKNLTYYEQYGKGYQVTNVSLYVLPKFSSLGRLGNQMFVYASLLGIAQAQGRRTFFDPTSDLAKTFKLSNVGVINGSEMWPVIKEQSFYDERLMNLPLQNLTIESYLQSYWYFAGVEREVKQEFTFHDPIANAAAMILRDLYVKYKASMIVGVHVRRTDFLVETNKQIGYGVPEKSYFMKAISLMKSKFPGRNITFLVASDDLPWCHKNLPGKDVYFMPPAEAAVHMAVLSKCDHVIISGGTFGFWSAWLAYGHVIYYPGYMRKDSILGKWFRDDLYYPKTWTPMED